MKSGTAVTKGQGQWVVSLWWTVLIEGVTCVGQRKKCLWLYQALVPGVELPATAFWPITVQYSKTTVQPLSLQPRLLTASSAVRTALTWSDLTFGVLQLSSCTQLSTRMSRCYMKNPESQHHLHNHIKVCLRFVVRTQSLEEREDVLAITPQWCSQAPSSCCGKPGGGGGIINNWLRRLIWDQEMEISFNHLFQCTYIFL